jgi:hypothetical protein
MAATIYGSLAVANSIAGTVTQLDGIKSSALNAVALGGDIITKLQIRYEDSEIMNEAKIAPLQSQLAATKVSLQEQVNAINVPTVAEFQALAATAAPA